MTAILRRRRGPVQHLSVDAWSAPATHGERALLRSLTGPVLDVGCGPGRLVVALAETGVPALGIDTSPLAVRLTVRRGGAALSRSVFDHLPAEGRWASLLLFDGNIGIGGSPTRLLARARDLLAPRGQIVVETQPPGVRTDTDLARLETDAGTSGWFPWAWVGSHDIDVLGQLVGLRTVARHTVENRWFAVLRP